MKVLLTGATGFVGSHTAQALRNQGHEVYALVRRTSRYEELKKIGVELVMGDLRKGESAPNLPSVEVVLHVAGIIKARNAREFNDVNAGGTELLIRSLPKSVERVVLVSSISARGPNADEKDIIGRKGPVSEYGKSKLTGESLARKMLPSEKLVILRPPIVYGPGDREALTLFKMFKSGLFPLIGGEGRMSFVYVQDLANILVSSLTASAGRKGPYYTEDGSGGYPWKEVLSIATEIFKRKIRLVPLPLWVGKIAATTSEFAGKITRGNPMLTREKFNEIREPYWFCVDPACHKDFNLNRPHKIPTGFALTKEWYEKQGWL